MISDKRASLRPLLESATGIHLTIYLVNHRDLADLKRQIVDAVNEANEFLYPVMTNDERKKFLEPLEALLHEAGILKKMTGNIGLFRTVDSFRILNVPVAVEPTCVVASTFHVKPLLRWIQSDRDFLLLGIEDGAAHLYLGGLSRLTRLDTLIFPDVLRAGAATRRSVDLVNEWLLEIAGKIRPRLFIVGRRDFADAIFRGLKYPKALRSKIYADFHDNLPAQIVPTIQSQLKHEVSTKLQRALTEFRIAEDMNLARKNVFQIARAAILGRVRKLIIADGIKIFGKIDPKSGGVVLHPFDLDHEDDDILDDLAQTVLKQGGEVIVASREDIPKGRPALAILDHDEPPNKEQRFDSIFAALKRRTS